MARILMCACDICHQTIQAKDYTDMHSNSPLRTFFAGLGRELPKDIDAQKHHINVWFSPILSDDDDDDDYDYNDGDCFICDKCKEKILELMLNDLKALNKRVK